jgi:hypothetical protein
VARAAGALRFSAERAPGLVPGRARLPTARRGIASGQRRRFGHPQRGGSDGGGEIDEFFDLSTWVAAIIGSIVLLLGYRLIVHRDDHGGLLSRG